MEIEKNPIQFVESNLIKLADEIIESKENQIADLIFSHQNDGFSAHDIQKVISLVNKKISRFKSKNEKECVQAFFKVFPQHFKTDASHYEFPKDPQERRAIIEMLLEVNPSALEALKLPQLSLEEILECLPTRTMSYKESAAYVENFKEFGLMEHLNKQISAEKFFEVLDKILNQSSLTSECLAGNISKLNSDCLDHKEKIIFCNKIEEFYLVERFFNALPIIQALDELKKIEDPSELALQLGNLFSIGGSCTCHSLISEMNKDPHFEKNLSKLDFNDKFLLAQKICGKTLKTHAFVDVENIIGQLAFREDLKKTATPSEYLQMCEKIISLGEQGISINFARTLIMENREEVKLNFEDKLTLVNKMTAINGDIFRWAVDQHDLDEWVFREKMEEIGEVLEEVLKNERAEAFGILILAMHEDLVKRKNSEWVLERSNVIDESFSIEKSVQLIEMWSGHGSRAISMINNGVDEEFLKKLGEVEPISLRIDHCKKLMVLLGEPFALKIIKNFGLLNLEKMSEENYHDLFLLLASQGPLAAEKLMPYLKEGIKNPKAKLLIYRQMASHGPETFQELLKYQESFSTEDKTYLLDYVSYLAKRNLVSSYENQILSLCKDEKESISIEMLMGTSYELDLSLLSLQSISSLNEELEPFLVKEAEKITEKEIEDLSQFVEKHKVNPKSKVAVELFNDIQKIENGLAKRQLLKWCVYIFVQQGKENIKITDGLLPLIYQYQSPSLRFFLVRQLYCVKKLYLKASTKDSVKPKSVEEFSRLLLSRCIEEGLPEEQAQQIYEKVIKKSSNTFKDTKDSQVLINFFSNIISNSHFTEEKFLALAEVLGKILDIKKNKDIIKELQMLNAILNVFGREGFLSCIEKYSSQSAGEFFLEKFQKMFPVKVEGDFSQAYLETFGKFRHPEAIFTYLGSVNQLPLEEKNKVMKALQLYVEGVLSGKNNFSKLRYDTENGRYPHLEKIFKNNPAVRESWLDKGKAEVLSIGTIEESDDPEDLLQIGTEVTGSCQRVDGESKLNKCLVGYLLHGDVCPIVIKKDGKIVARSLLRLLWDEKKKAPVLLQERIYANSQNPEFEKAINEWAIKRAAKMGIPLISEAIGKTDNVPPYEGRVMFLGGPAPYIYSDAGNGVMDGHEPFEFTGCHVLYQPK